MADERYVLIWKPQSDIPMAPYWYIRGISRDGAFYGTIHVVEGGRAVIYSVSSRLPDDVLPEFLTLAARIDAGEQAPTLEADAAPRGSGTLARGNPGSGRILCRYPDDVGHAAAFARIIQLLEPAMTAAVAQTRAALPPTFDPAAPPRFPAPPETASAPVRYVPNAASIVGAGSRAQRRGISIWTVCAVLAVLTGLDLAAARLDAWPVRYVFLPALVLILLYVLVRSWKR